MRSRARALLIASLAATTGITTAVSPGQGQPQRSPEMTPPSEPTAMADQPVDWRARIGGPSGCGTQEIYEAKMVALGLGDAVSRTALACLLEGNCDNAAQRDAAIPTPETPVKVFRLLFHVLCNDDGSSCVESQASVDAQMSFMNANFVTHRIQFVYETQFHSSSTYRNLDNCVVLPMTDACEAELNDMKNLYADTPDTQINVYVANGPRADTLNGEPCGCIYSFATFPWDITVDPLGNLGGIVMNAAQFSATGTTLTHEMGHNIGLWHTQRGVSEVATCGACYEFAAGLHDDRGDFCSDTDPTPRNSSCLPPGGDDCNGDPWGDTEPQNYMGYAPSSCRTEFTQQQAGRMHCWIEDMLTGWLEPAGQPFLVPAGTSPLPDEAEAGDQITLFYGVSNPSPIPFDLFLGASIRPASGGSFINSVDCEGCGSDALVAIGGGVDQQFTRCFTIPPDAPAGLYEVCYAIWDPSNCGPGIRYDTICRNDLTVLASRNLTILAFSGPNGSVNPSGAVPVPEGACQTFVATPDPSYQVDLWYLDGPPPVQTGGSQYTVCPVTDVTTLNVFFRWVEPSDMTVLLPNGGETQCQGKQMSIAWHTTGDCGDVRLELLKGGSIDQVIDDSTPDDGTARWRIPFDQQEGSDYRVRACCLSSGSCDDSDGSFEIRHCEIPPVMQIRTLNDLRSMSENWGDGLHPRNGHYVLMNDIDARDTRSWNGGLGFKPIGTGYSDYFRGIFDGQGFSIIDLEIDRPDEPLVGMFSVIMDSAVVKNLTLTCEMIRGKGHGPGDDGGLGALVGQNAGKILNCHIVIFDKVWGAGGSRIGGLAGESTQTGTIVNCSAIVEINARGDDPDNTGGLVGENSGLIKWCWTEGAVDGDVVGSNGDNVGGLVGRNNGPGVIMESYSSCRWVDGEYRSGGIAGLNEGTIRDCYSHSRVDANGMAGGIAGQNAGNIEACYVIGVVDANNEEGRLIGRNYSTITNSFYTGSPAVGGGGTVTNCYSKTIAELMQQVTFTTKWETNWDFDDVWTIDEGVSPPKLRGIGSVLMPPTGVTASEGEPDGVHICWSSVVDAGVYGVYRSESLEGDPGLLGWERSLCFIDGTAEPLQTYYYWVTAAATTAGARESAFSNSDSGWRDFPPPPAPTGVGASGDLPLFIVIQWNAVTGADYYRVYQADTQDGEKTRICDNELDQSCHYVPEKADTVYFFWVTAVNGVGESDFGGPDTGRMACTEDAECDDGLYCNGGESCQGGVCLQGAAPCIDLAHCDEATDLCICLNDTECDDGFFCNGAETCDPSGLCQPGTDIGCGDGVGCTVDSCNESTSLCDHIPDDPICDNGLYCDGDETCDVALDCQPGTAIDCNDGVSCTVDSCNEGDSSCDHIPDDALCDNPHWCDGSETCDPVRDCQPGTARCIDLAHCDEVNDVCICTDDSECDDGLFCNGAEVCDAGGVCQPGTVNDCNDGVSCTVDSCNEDTDSCDNIPDDGLCDNRLWCDGLETCDSVQDCQAGTPPVIDDTVGCTDDSCDEVNDVVVHAANDANCDNGLWCDGLETCDPAQDCQPATGPCIDIAHCDEDDDICVCVTDDDCDDSVGCTDDTCEDGRCVYTPDDGVCDNGLFCDGVETCDPIADCQSDADPCDDERDCTADTCDEAVDECHNDIDPGNCLIDALCYTDGSLNPENSCQSCQPLTDAFLWSPVPDATPCDDDNSCTSVDACVSGNCTGTPSPDPCCGNPDPCCGISDPCCGSSDPCCGVDCDDNDRCTTDNCDPADGSCNNEAIVCSAGQTCDLDTGSCVPCTADSDCDDGNPCTDDTCDSSGECVFTGDDTNSCDDGDVCNGVETCENGVCVAGTPLDCDDGAFCNGIETCEDGECEDGVPPCADGEICDEDVDECMPDSDGDGVPDDDDVCVNSPAGCSPEPDGCCIFIFTPPAGQPQPFTEYAEVCLFATGTSEPSPEDRCSIVTPVEATVELSFDFWGGVPAAQIHQNPLKLVMDSDKTVTVSWQEIDGPVCNTMCGAGCGCTPGAPAVGLIFFGLMGFRFIGSSRRKRTGG